MINSHSYSNLETIKLTRHAARFASGDTVPFPVTSMDLSDFPCVLGRGELLTLIATLRDRVGDGVVAVVQGGNRYLYEYLKSSSAMPVCNIKATSLAKCPPYKMLNTLLTSEERQAVLPKECVDQLHLAFDQLSAEDRDRIEVGCRSSFGDIRTLFRFGAVGNVIQALCKVRVQFPFREPTHAHTRVNEMRTTHEQVRMGEPVLCTDTLLGVILVRCGLAKMLANCGGVSIVDHVLYRGRTLYAMAWIMKLMNVENWSFYALCSDSLAASVSWHRTTILAPGKWYPFENSVSTEGGYWDEVDSHFVFRDLRGYQRLLRGVIGVSVESGSVVQVISCWYRLVTRLSDMVRCLLDDDEFTCALIMTLIYAKSVGRSISVEALQNQRAINIGYCPCWGVYCEKFACRVSDTKNREAFKQQVAKVVVVIDGLLSETELGATAVRVYSRNRVRIDSVLVNRLLRHNDGTFGWNDASD